MTMNIRAVIYCRCSTEEESQKDALAKQVKEAKECVRKQGWLLADSYVESRSGTSTRGRAEYNRLYDDLEKDRFDMIVIKSQDRLMRNTKDWYLFVDRLTASGKKLYIYLEGKFYTADDALITGIKAILAEDYSRELSKKINNAHRNRQRSNGAAILTSNTYGYKKLPDKSIALIEEEADVKRRMYELCVAGYGSRTIASILKKDGVVNRKGGFFSASDIRRMIRSPLNMGTVVMNQVHYDFDSKKTIKVPEERHFVYENKVPAIVTKELWSAANAAMDRRAAGEMKKGHSVRGKNPGTVLLSGKLVCGLCGEPYYRTVRKRGKKGVKIHEWKCRQYLYYGRKSNQKADNSFNEDAAGKTDGCDNIHLDEVKLYTLLQKVFENQYQIDKERIIPKMLGFLNIVLLKKDDRPELLHIEAQYDKIKSQLNVLLEKLLDGVISNQIYQEKQSQLEQRLQELQEKKEKLVEKSTQEQKQKERLREIEEYLQQGDGILKATLDSILGDVKKIVVYPQKMEVFFDTVHFLEEDTPEILQEQVRESIVIPCGNTFHYLEKKKEDREIIVALMNEDPFITARQIAEKLKISLSGANYRIRVLKKEGRIQFQGSGGRGKWEILTSKEQ